MPQITEGIRELQKALDKFLAQESALKNLELECRFGRLIKQPRRFNANLTKAAFYDIKTGVSDSLRWRSHARSCYRQHSAGRIRTRLYEDGHCETVMKKRLMNLDLSVSHMPFDIRVSLSRETVVDPGNTAQNEKQTESLASERKRFSHRKEKSCWQTDATLIEATNRSTRTYQLELECVDLRKALEKGTRHLAKDCLLTLYELLEFTAPLDKQSRLSLANYREFV